MTGVHTVLGAFAGAALALLITAARLWLVNRFAGPDHDHTTGPAEPCVPASLDVLDAERRYQQSLQRRTTPRRSSP
jgi:hypothetical protein